MLPKEKLKLVSMVVDWKQTDKNVNEKFFHT